MIEKEAINVMTQAKEEAGQAFLGKVQFNVPQYHAVIKALEKQIPKKSKQDKEYPLGRICPGCYRYLSNVQFVPSGYHYCENCGQALDWSEEE